MGRKRNTFSKAIKQLKSTRIDEKLQTLNEIPTNNTSGLYDLVPGALTRTEVDKDNPTIPDYTGIDWDRDGGDGRDTSGLFDAEGNSLFVTPPGDNSYILGPMASMFYNYASYDWTMIGYIRESDRRFVNLGYLYENKTAGREFSGKLEDWTGNPEGNPEEWTEDWPNASNFNSYGQLTLEQALWFRDTAKKGGTGSSGHESSDFRAFYPGPPSSTPDAFGRYYCTIVGTPKATTPNTKTVAPIDMCSSDNFSAIADLMKQFGNNVRAVYKGGKLVYDKYPTIDPEGAAYLRKKAKEHGLSAERTEELLADDPGELLKFVQMQDSLQADIERYSKEQKDAEREARNIAIGFGVDVALTLAGGWLVKGIGKGLGFAYKGIKAANKATQINKAAKLIKAADKIDDAAAIAKATQAYNKTQKAAKAAQAANKATKATQKAIKTAKPGSQYSPYPKGYTGKTTTGQLTGKTVTGKPIQQIPKGQPGSSTSPYPKGYTSKTSITKTIPKNKVPKKGPDGKFRETDLNIKGPDGNVIAKNVKNSKTGQWERISKPGSNASRADIAKWERLEGQVSGKAWQNYVKTGELNPGILGDPLAAMNPFTKHGLRSGPTALAKKFGIPAGVGAGVGGAVIGNEIRKGVAGLSSSEQVQQFTSNIKSAIENVVSKASSPEQVTNSTIQLVSQYFPQEERTAARFFMQYLTGNAPENAGDLVPEADQEDAWKQMTFGEGGGITVNGPMKNVFGGEPADSLTVDKDGNAVFKFNFAPKTNKVEFAGAPKDRWSSEYKEFLTKFEPFTQYWADLTPDFGETKGSKFKGALAGSATNVFKLLDKITPDGSKLVGGIKTARDLEGNIKIPMSKLKTLNPDAYNRLKSQQNTSSKWMPNKDVKTAYDPNKGTTVNFKRQFGAGGDGGATEVDVRHKGAEIFKHRRGEFQDPKNLDNVDSEIKTNLDKELKKFNLTKKGKKKSKSQVAHYEPQGELIKESYTFCANINLSEDRKSNILKNIKKPVVLPESKKKHKVKPGQRYKGKTNFQGMDKLMSDVKPQNPFKKERNAWSKDWQGYNARLSQEKKNAVLELVGDGKQAFNYMLNDSRIKNAEEMEKFWGLHPELYSYVFNGKKYKETRKEQVKGDYLVFLTDENGEKTTMLQSDISIKLAEEHEKEMLTEYNKTGEPTPFLKDPLMKKVAKRLKNEIDYPDKPAKKGYPNQPPPKQVDGWHPEYGKKYKYDKLDPVSAVMMKRAPTGDPEIDANVKKASMKPKVEKKRSNWREDIEV